VKLAVVKDRKNELGKSLNMQPIKDLKKDLNK
jgi:hypothetical protein